MIKVLSQFMLVASLSLIVACGGNGNSGDQALIQGTWETIRMVTDGEEVPQDRIAQGTTVTFDGNQMITKRWGEVKATWTFTLDATQNPKRMTINRAEPGEEEKLSLLIYQIEGDTLSTSSGSRTYPTSFSPETEKGCYLTVRRRIPPDKVDLPMEEKLRIEVVSITPRTGNYVRVKYKVTNTAGRNVVRAKAMFVVLDAEGAEIGSESHYVVKSGDGEFAPGATAEDDFLITVTDPQQAASARVELERVRGG